jgi:hypothetical protein
VAGSKEKGEEQPMDGDASIIILAVVLLLFAAAWIYVLFWVSRDANARGLNGGLWAVIVWFFSVVGLAIYLVQRPKGRLMPCPSCGQKRHETAWICPHCMAKR